MTRFALPKMLLVAILGATMVQPLLAQTKDKDGPAWIRTACERPVVGRADDVEGSKVPAASACLHIRTPGNAVTYDANSDHNYAPSTLPAR